MTVWAYVAIVYAAGFLVAPFVGSLINGWPFARPRLDSLDTGATFFIALFWPIVLVSWGLYVWWVLCSSAGAKAHEALKRELEKAARDE
jgi:hypothetical protein